MTEGQGNKREITVSQEVSSYSGPIPPAKEIARYEDVQPGAADRLIAMAEREQADTALLRKRALYVTTLLTFCGFTVLVVALLLNANLLIPLALAISYGFPPVTRLVRELADVSIERKERELDIRIKRDRHELDMIAAKQQLALPPVDEDDADPTSQRLALSSDTEDEAETRKNS